MEVSHNNTVRMKHLIFQDYWPEIVIKATKNDLDRNTQESTGRIPAVIIYTIPVQ